jgi:NDP-sugar pyrophosphorylase family protein
MKAVILAAGKGRRMRPLTASIPKPLVRVRGKTFLEHILDALPAAVDEVIIVIGYKGALIKKFLGDAYGGKKIIYLVQRNLAGTGRAALLARPYLKPKERFMIIYADELVTKKEIKDCLAPKFSWLTRHADIPEKSAVATVSARGRITAVIEKPKKPASNLVVGGVMVTNTDIFDYRPARHRNGEYHISSMMNKFLKSYPVMAVPGKDNLYFSTKRDVDKYNKGN